MLIERVLVNLLENAVKYTPAGTAIEVEAHAHSGEVVLVVDDHGPGLPPGREEAIFDKFERGARESATPGVGLGLAICHDIVLSLGGQIELVNREQAGRITGLDAVVRLPLVPPGVGDNPAP